MMRPKELSVLQNESEDWHSKVLDRRQKIIQDLQSSQNAKQDASPFRAVRALKKLQSQPSRPTPYKPPSASPFGTSSYPVGSPAASLPRSREVTPPKGVPPLNSPPLPFPDDLLDDNDPSEEALMSARAELDEIQLQCAELCTSTSFRLQSSSEEGLYCQSEEQDQDVAEEEELARQIQMLRQRSLGSGDLSSRGDIRSTTRQLSASSCASSSAGSSASSSAILLASSAPPMVHDATSERHDLIRRELMRMKLSVGLCTDSPPSSAGHPAGSRPGSEGLCSQRPTSTARPGTSLAQDLMRNYRPVTATRSECDRLSARQLKLFDLITNLRGISIPSSETTAAWPRGLKLCHARLSVAIALAKWREAADALCEAMLIEVPSARGGLRSGALVLLDGCEALSALVFVFPEEWVCGLIWIHWFRKLSSQCVERNGEATDAEWRRRELLDEGFVTRALDCLGDMKLRRRMHTYLAALATVVINSKLGTAEREHRFQMALHAVDLPMPTQWEARPLPSNHKVWSWGPEEVTAFLSAHGLFELCSRVLRFGIGGLELLSLQRADLKDLWKNSTSQLLPTPSSDGKARARWASGGVDVLTLDDEGEAVQCESSRTNPEESETSALMAATVAIEWGETAKQNSTASSSLRALVVCPDPIGSPAELAATAIATALRSRHTVSTSVMVVCLFGPEETCRDRILYEIERISAVSRADALMWWVGGKKVEEIHDGDWALPSATGPLPWPDILSRLPANSQDCRAAVVVDASSSACGWVPQRPSSASSTTSSQRIGEAATCLGPLDVDNPAASLSMVRLESDRIGNPAGWWTKRLARALDAAPAEEARLPLHTLLLNGSMALKGDGGDDGHESARCSALCLERMAGIGPTLML
eukprot:NODE_154_length_2988_cov_25.296019_g142_i0.p1 GENE.NODE_154_length_2988_cov_25.296019_g142_i0~~NODE_154_length_2988_cov_25.296019_g142_i0.p1  ORF type:complete len:880 (+),score=135.36 NODE_154_length_2988_cov_25.296019_g142_i0:72-2711(+)